MAEYRWNVAEAAAAYDAAANVVHPYYAELQDELVRQLPLAPGQRALIVDAGGGSGRLLEKALAAFPQAEAVLVDQSEPFLALAERRLAKFAPRAKFMQARLQDDWTAALPEPPVAIVSMSAIHHLEPAEKQSLYRRCCAALAPGGALLNGDEVRAEDDEEYRRQVADWGQHMRRLVENRLVPPGMEQPLLGWIERNVVQFGRPKSSGEDCHETAATQLAYFRAAGFSQADAPWTRELWTLLRGVK